MSTNHELLKHMSGLNRELREHIGEVFAGFGQLHKAALEDGALGAGTKELIALAFSIAQQCDGCIASHARNAVRKGVTAEEVAEMIGVAMLMMGGPATIYGPRAWEAYQEFAGSAPQPAG